MEELNDSRVSENFSTEVTDIDYSIVKLSSLVPGWSTVTLIIYIIIAMLIGLPGNTLVLIVLRKVKRKTSTDWFVIFIAACDLISLSVSGPLYILFLVPDVWTAISSEFVCKFHYYIIHCVFLESLLLITCMGIDRYMKTCKPHSVLFTPKTTVKSCLIITAVSCMFNISQIYTTKLNIYGDCVLDATKAVLLISVYGVYNLTVLLCSGLVGTMYWKIAIRIRRRIKVEPSVVTNTGTNYTANKHRNKTKGLSGNQDNCETVRHQHDTFSYPEREDGNVSTRTTVSKYGTNDASIRASHGQTIRTNTVKNNQIMQLLDLNTKASTSFGREGNENQGRIREEEVHNHESQRSKQVNRTSKTMSAITLVFILSTAIPTVALTILSAQENVKGHPIARVIVFFVSRLYLINNFANPFFYIRLSSEFKRRAKETLKGCKRYF